MQIWPAIDLLHSQAVRLTKGDYDQVKVYFKDPEEILRFFNEKGAKHLHVVDLDGAREGKLSNLETIRHLCREARQEIEVGGGIRSKERIETYLTQGVRYVILGTVALEDPVFTEEMIRKYGDHIVIGIDAKNGMVATRGWKDVSAVPGPVFCRRMQEIGASRIIYTDISKDGMLSGTNLELYRSLKEDLSLKITASGGITYMKEVHQLKNMGIHSAIIGKALYEGVLDLSEVLQAEEESC
ncbi:MAG: 1-(5-phosphoribosyl)-5-[Firmicutes bacterium]|nr:1-(5-phosphoribosyl)-5-[(5-phosphoribosylamino)methylideneamino]imidazole-4-carboxamide isomerase [Bacillota bacterium]